MRNPLAEFSRATREALADRNLHGGWIEQARSRAEWLALCDEIDSLLSTRAETKVDGADVKEVFKHLHTVRSIEAFRRILAAKEKAMTPQPKETVEVPRELLHRAYYSLQRWLDEGAPRRVPADYTDADIVQSEIGKWLSAAPAQKGGATDKP